MRLSSQVSTSWASTSGAVTRTSGSPANTTSPSGTAHTSPVNRRSARRSRNAGGNSAQAGEVGDVALVEAPRLEPGEGVVEPGGDEEPALVGGRLRTNSSKVASWSTPPAW